MVLCGIHLLKECVLIKSANEVHAEKEKQTGAVLEEQTKANEIIMKKSAKKTKAKSAKAAAPKKDLTSKLLKASSSIERKTLLNPTEKSQTKKVNNHDITFNNLDKIYYPRNQRTESSFQTRHDKLLLPGYAIYGSVYERPAVNNDPLSKRYYG